MEGGGQTTLTLETRLWTLDLKIPKLRTGEAYFPRSSTRWIFPVRVLGSSARTSTCRGAL